MELFLQNYWGFCNIAPAGLKRQIKMKLLFVTDLHGCTWKYDKLYKTALQHEVDIILNGGDMLPKDGNLFQQDRFITRYLQRHFQRFEQARIHYLCLESNILLFHRIFNYSNWSLKKEVVMGNTNNVYLLEILDKPMGIGQATLYKLPIPV